MTYSLSPVLSLWLGWLVGFSPLWFFYCFALQRNTGAFQIEVIGNGTNKFHHHLVPFCFFLFFLFCFGGYTAIVMYFLAGIVSYSTRGGKVLFDIYLFSCLYINGLFMRSKGGVFFIDTCNVRTLNR